MQLSWKKKQEISLIFIYFRFHVRKWSSSDEKKETKDWIKKSILFVQKRLKVD